MGHTANFGSVGVPRSRWVYIEPTRNEKSIGLRNWLQYSEVAECKVNAKLIDFSWSLYALACALTSMHNCHQSVHLHVQPLLQHSQNSCYLV